MEPRELALLLQKAKDKEDFISLYKESLEIYKLSKEPELRNIGNLDHYLSEEMSKEIDILVICDLFWMEKDYYIQIGLREDKLKRILRK